MKLLFTGPKGAGKTQLLRRACGKGYDPSVVSKAPSGHELAAFEVLPPKSVEGTTVRGQIWDLCFSTVTDPYQTLPRECKLSAVAIAFDATSKESFNQVRVFVADVIARWPTLPVAIVACKCDGERIADRALILEMMQVLRSNRKESEPPIWWAETSAADGHGVDRFITDFLRSAVGVKKGLGVPPDTPDEWGRPLKHKDCLIQ